MDSSKGLMGYLLLSLAAHGVGAGIVAYAPQGMPQKATQSEPIEISFVQYAEPHTSNPAEPAQRKKIAHKAKGIPIPRLKPEAVSEKLPPSEFEKMMQTKLRKQEEQLLKLSADTRVPEVKTLPQTSAELLSDPVKGKIFVGYFGSVKHQIEELLVNKYAKKSIGRGSVCLFFVLDRNGRVVSVSVVDAESSADEYLRDLAIQCLREAAPFGNFPQSLHTERISFNVTIYFEER